jgi:predicted RNA-binding protein with PUA-like domain
MAYWLMKSEPSTFSIDDLRQARKQTAPWDGVRNYQARNFMRDQMRVGDQAFFYHSNCQSIGIVGILEIQSEAYPDFTAFNENHRYFDPKSDRNKPRWMMVDVKFIKKFSRIITLTELRACEKLGDLIILRKGNRLSITPVTAKEWDAILSLVN